MNNKSKIDHFYLVDGSGYIFRAYYALPPLSRKSDGLPTGAVNGFCKMLFDLLEEARSDDSKNKIPRWWLPVAGMKVIVHFSSNFSKV